MTELNTVGNDIIDGTIASFNSNKGWADKAIVQLSDDRLHVALDANTNSIAVIMKHVAGNLLSRWTDFLTTDGEKPWRNRDDEFIDTFRSRDELIVYWNSGWQRLFESLSSLSTDDLAKTITIRGEPHSVPLAIQRSLAHTAYHVGQIMLIARIVAGDQWSTITIPRGASARFNQQVWGKGHKMTDDEQMIQHLYELFNSRDIDGVLSNLDEGVVWANGMENTHVHGIEAVRKYWTNQWSVISPHVEPKSVSTSDDGSIVVEVNLIVHDLEGALLLDEIVGHTFKVEGGKIMRFDIRPGSKLSSVAH